MHEPGFSPRRSLTGSESIAVALAGSAALIVVIAYVGDRIGVAFTPVRMLAAGGLSAALLLIALGRWAVWDAGETATFAGIVGGTFGWLLWIARPTLFPLGSGPDLTHHLLLINYIETHWTLVHDSRVQEFLGEMVQYTPGSHILTALAGAWTRTNGLHALHGVMAASAALKAAFVFLIARRVLPHDIPRIPLAALASISLFASQTYFLGSFAQYSFLAQVVAECFAVAMFWTLIVWDEEQSRWAMAAAGILGAAVFLTWPILIGPPLVVLGLLVVLPVTVRLKPDTTSDTMVRLKPDTTTVLARVGDAMVCVVPIAIVAALFSFGRMDYVVIAGTGGEVVSPAVKAYGWPFVALSSAGLVIAAFSLRNRSTRTVALFAGAILLQAGALYLFARARGNDPYMARKMFYIFLYAQAVGVAVTVGSLWRAIVTAERQSLRLTAVAWAIAVAALLFAARPLAGAPKSLIVAKHPATSLELEEAGTWVREHVDPHCVEYLVGDDNTAYWLHLAVLGNPRRGARTGDNATYELTPALVRWLTPGGLPYAIADLRVIPTDIGNASEVVRQFGRTAVIKRKGPSSCGSG
ncbi:MAG TPA: hypothetical protein VF456_27265 [Vicinamibacterales bacterium]